MRIYILRAFTDKCKWDKSSWIIGIFTNRAKLIAAIKKNADLLGLDNCEGFRDSCCDMFGQLPENMYYLNDYMDTGEIEEVDANEIYPDGIF